MLPRGADGSRRIRLSVFFVSAVASLLACDKLVKRDASDDPPPKVSTAAPPPTTPPAAPVGTPAALFADASDLDGKTPYEQARLYEGAGQLWMARLVLEQRALGPEATRDETELLARICHEQADEKCVASCGEKLGRKLKFDGGAPRARDAGRDPPADGATADLAKAQELAAKGKNDEARALLEPKLLSGKASKAEISTLQAICLRQGDRMCVALCESKLKGK
jgi:hypothetical protein